MMRAGRLGIVVTAVVLAAFAAGCGNPLEGGSEPSGSVLHITGVDRVDVQDLYFCEGQEVDYARANLTISNDSRPNFEDSPTTADGTNSRVTLYRYRVDYAVLNMTASIPGLDGAGISLTIEPDAEGNVVVLLMTEAQLEYIRANYPMVGNGQVMIVRADVTIWGKDEFKVDTTVKYSATIQVDDFNPCIEDIVPPDEQTNN